MKDRKTKTKTPTLLWHSLQRGVVSLLDRQLHVQRPRLRDKHG